MAEQLDQKLRAGAVTEPEPTVPTYDPTRFKLDGGPLNRILSGLTANTTLQQERNTVVDHPSDDRDKEDDERATGVMASSLPQPALSALSKSGPDLDNAELEIERLKQVLAERRAQLARLLDDIYSTFGSNWTGPNANDYLGKYPALSNEVVYAVIANREAVFNDFALREALCIGGEYLRDLDGSVVSIYTLASLKEGGVLGKGGVGVVKDGYILKNNVLTRVVIKEPILADREGKDAAKRAEEKRKEQERITAYMREATNANLYLRDPIPGVARCLAVTEPRPNGLPVLVYEKITDKNGKVCDGIDYAKDKSILPSRKILALAGLCNTIANYQDPGLAHCDVKPENTLVNHRGELILSDPGSTTTIDERLKYELSDDHPSKGGLFRAYTQGDREVLEPIGLTPVFANVVNIVQAFEQGHDIRVIDRQALAVMIIDLLQSAGILSGIYADWQNPEIYRVSDLKVKLALDPTQFPTPALHGLLALVDELGNMNVPVANLRSLRDIAQDLERVASQCMATGELDGLYQSFAQLPD
ncbi:MAG: hypothetical protein HY817_02495 [Candidatus Abawacabacteria bacterium]|nr:hypothetical protein [Candidatus Abawacabacteria bacterium]